MPKYSKLSFWKFNIFQLILNFLFPPKEKDLSGKLYVSGEGSLEITFKECNEAVCVYFDDESNIVPCNPGTEDFLNWHIVDEGCYYKLVIAWDVYGVRTIVWNIW